MVVQSVVKMVLHVGKATKLKGYLPQKLPLQIYKRSTKHSLLVGKKISIKNKSSYKQTTFNLQKTFHLQTKNNKAKQFLNSWHVS